MCFAPKQQYASFFEKGPAQQTQKRPLSDIRWTPSSHLGNQKVGPPQSQLFDPTNWAKCSHMAPDTPCVPHVIFLFPERQIWEQLNGVCRGCQSHVATFCPISWIKKLTFSRFIVGVFFPQFGRRCLGCLAGAFLFGFFACPFSKTCVYCGFGGQKQWI